MAITLQLAFDNDWAARLAPMVVMKIDEMRDHPLVVELLVATAGVESVDDLTTKQKAKLLILVHLLRDLIVFEGQTAAEAANQTVVDDLQDNFPLEFGPA